MEEIQEREFDINVKKERVERLHRNEESTKKRVMRKHFSKFKQTLKRQIGKIKESTEFPGDLS